jgi:hypothetical protein
VSFAPKELRETLSAASDCSFLSDHYLLEDQGSEPAPRRNKRVIQMMQGSFCTSDHPMTSAKKRLILRFYLAPYEIEKISPTSYKLLCKKLDGTSEAIITNMVVSSIGFEGETPFDLDYGPNNTFANSNGVINHDIGLYTTGWAKTGALGSLSSSLNDAILVADQILSDRPKLEARKIIDFDFTKLFAGVTCIDGDTWKQIDDFERIMGKRTGKQRTKVYADFIDFSY